MYIKKIYSKKRPRFNPGLFFEYFFHGIHFGHALRKDWFERCLV